VDEEVGKNAGVEIVSMEILLEESHIISVHMPLTRNTENFFDQKTFSLMKQKPMFINCARGGVVDEDDLIEALDHGQVTAAGLDVLKSETPDLENCQFLHRENVILTPHAAFYSFNSMEESQILTVEHVRYFLEGQLAKIPLVNPPK
jgi:phosphoglycerate dehydrogenase-like enzyme